MCIRDRARNWLHPFKLLSSLICRLGRLSLPFYLILTIPDDHHIVEFYLRVDQIIEIRIVLSIIKQPHHASNRRLSKSVGLGNKQLLQFVEFPVLLGLDKAI